MKDNIIIYITSGIAILILLGFMTFETYLWIHYGNMPKDQIPALVWWWVIRG